MMSRWSFYLRLITVQVLSCRTNEVTLSDDCDAEQSGNVAGVIDDCTGWTAGVIWRVSEKVMGIPVKLKRLCCKS